jgi:hypothetical protein
VKPGEVRPDSLRPGSASWALRSTYSGDRLLAGSSAVPRPGAEASTTFLSEGFRPGILGRGNPCGPVGSVSMLWPERMDPLPGALVGGLVAYHDLVHRYRSDDRRVGRAVVGALLGALTGQPIDEHDIANYRFHQAMRTPGGSYMNRFPCTGPVFDLRGRPQGR